MLGFSLTTMRYFMPYDYARLPSLRAYLKRIGARPAYQRAMAKGDPIDIHEVMLNTEQASLGFSMALQVRNKLIDAYQEVMRMSV